MKVLILPSRRMEIGIRWHFHIRGPPVYAVNFSTNLVRRLAFTQAHENPMA
jgi:hypothetical protein